MLSEMGKAGVMPTVDTFNTLMDACIRRVDPPAVLRLFRQMQQSGRSTAALGMCVNRNVWSGFGGTTGCPHIEHAAAMNFHGCWLQCLCHKEVLCLAICFWSCLANMAGATC